MNLYRATKVALQPLNNTSSFLTTKVQQPVYNKLNNFSWNHLYTGRFVAIFVVTIDIAAETIKKPIAIINSLAYAAMTLIATAFNLPESSLSYSFICFIDAVKHTGSFLITPLKLFYQLYRAVKDPQHARPYFVNYTTH